VVEAGDAAGLSFLGYTSQAGFLIGCGLAEKATREAAVWQSDRHQGTAARVLQQQAINRLTLPGEMGERFQVMALGRKTGLVRHSHRYHSAAEFMHGIVCLDGDLSDIGRDVQGQ